METAQGCRLGRETRYRAYIHSAIYAMDQQEFLPVYKQVQVLLLHELSANDRT
jgi:hypothetical protein